MRYFLLEQSPKQICSGMGLTEARFEELKERPKSFYAALDKGDSITDTAASRLLIQNDAAGVSRILPIVAHAIAVFGDEGKATHWLTTPLQILENRTPANLIHDPAGAALVERILTRIEHNIPS